MFPVIHVRSRLYSSFCYGYFFLEILLVVECSNTNLCYSLHLLVPLTLEGYSLTLSCCRLLQLFAYFLLQRLKKRLASYDVLSLWHTKRCIGKTLMLLRESTRMYVEVSSSIRYGIIVVALVCFTHILRIIHQQEVLEKQKALILVGETLLLSTIQFDFDIQHPYEPLKLALKNLGITQKEVKQASISLINDT
jgi:hypothetical protein